MLRRAAVVRRPFSLLVAIAVACTYAGAPAPAADFARAATLVAAVAAGSNLDVPRTTLRGTRRLEARHAQGQAPAPPLGLLPVALFVSTPDFTSDPAIGPARASMRANAPWPGRSSRGPPGAAVRAS